VAGNSVHLGHLLIKVMSLLLGSLAFIISNLISLDTKTEVVSVLSRKQGPGRMKK